MRETQYSKERNKTKKTKKRLSNYERVIITSALPYVNNIPHLGNLICVVSADVLSRYLELKGIDFISILGTDEHGTTAEIKAKEEGITPQQLTDKYFEIHKKIYHWFNCGKFCFGRTSSKENIEISQHIFKRLDENGFIKEKELEQTYCEKCNMFLADRFVGGACPYCGYEDARGDQCDKCGKLLDSNQLLNPKCKICGSKPIIKKTKHLFIDLPKIQPELEKWVEKEKEGWSQNALSTTNSWLKEGLRERCITRDLKWGIPVPKKGYENKVFYSWFDAPIGYISISKESAGEKWEEFWKNKKNTALVQFMGKDNIPFHTILFPSFLIGTKEEWTLMTHISVNEYLNYEGDKFSKSRGIGIFGDDAMFLPFSSDVWRYYLMINRPEKTDSDFSWKDFEDKYNSEIIGTLGNLINRTLTFIKNNFNGEVGELDSNDNEFIEYQQFIESYENNMESLNIKKALKQIISLAHFGNEYFQKKEPWMLIKQGDEGKKKAKGVLTNLLNLIKDISILLYPFMPETAESIWEQSGFERLKWEDVDKDIENHTISNPKILFNKIEKKEFDEMKNMFGGGDNNKKNRKNIKNEESKEESKQQKIREIASKIDLKVAQIISVEEHPDADKLYKIKISLGDEERQIIAGLKKFFSIDSLVGKKIIVVSNLKPAKLRGEISQGMLLAADKMIDGKEEVDILSPSTAEVGEDVYFGNIKKKPSKEIDITEFFKMNLKTNQEGVVFAEELKEELIAGGKPLSSRLKNANIK